MIEFSGKNFTCDECPICEGLDYRLMRAKQNNHEPQLEYCCCDKVQDEFFLSGYCEDAFCEKSVSVKPHSPRKTGRAYRRHMRKHKNDRLMRMMTWGYNPAMGYTDWDWVNGTFQPVGKYIKYPKNSRLQKYYKNCSNRHFRHGDIDTPKGNSYRKHFEYVYRIF